MTKGVPSLRAGVSVLKFSLYFTLKFKKSQKIQNFSKMIQKKQNFSKMIQKKQKKERFLKKFTNFSVLFTKIYPNSQKICKFKQILSYF